MTFRWTQLRTILGLAALILIVPLVLAACGDDDGDSNGNGAGTEATSAGAENGDGSSEGSEDDASAGQGTWPEDKPIVFADFSWDSVIIHNRVMQFIIEHGYGYETESVSGSTIPMLQGLADNEIQATSEIWVENYPTWSENLADGEVLDLGTNYGQSEQGWYVPTYVIEGDPERGIEPMAPDLRTAEDLANYPEIFADPEEPGKGRFYNGVPGWEAVEINAAKMEVYGLTETFTDFRPGSTAAVLASLTSAYQTGDAWVGYLWEPHWTFAQMDLTKLEEPEYTDECWEQIRSGEEACAYPDVVVKISVNAEFGEQVPGIVEMMENYDSNADKTNQALLYMQENDISDHELAAIWYLQENQEDWVEWVPEDVAERVEQALDQASS